MPYVFECKKIYLCKLSPQERTSRYVKIKFKRIALNSVSINDRKEPEEYLILPPLIIYNVTQDPNPKWKEV